ncbi:UNVERIFIED_CONTAM: hypothetical protein GTU68_018647 [Idotea baltica]|nr:hypothetical protein [Idotea baltica]
MSSILTNTSAMVALQTLRTINTDLQKTQNEISTGKSVATAKDNASIWAISKVMEADVKGFKGISESLSLGESTVAVARQASETVTDLLTDIKGKIVAAQEENVDREKIQTDIKALSDQINTVVNAAQFNGLNLLKGTEDMNVLASLDRASDGSVTARNINVNRQDLSTAAGTYGSGTSLAANATASAAAVAVLKVDNNGTTLAFSVVGAAGGEASGGLFGLGGIDVTTEGGASAALGNVETLIQTAIDGAAQFGSAQGRIETQNEFVNKLMDSLKAGIGTMVDADMEETSARLQALQVQQQLGIQSLSIANQAPQSILSLFR